MCTSMSEPIVTLPVLSSQPGSSLPRWPLKNPILTAQQRLPHWLLHLVCLLHQTAFHMSAPVVLALCSKSDARATGGGIQHLCSSDRQGGRTQGEKGLQNDSEALSQVSQDG